MIKNMNFSQKELGQLEEKLRIMARTFPNVEIIDLERLNDLVAHDQVKILFQRVFLFGIDSPKAQHLATLAQLCLEGNYDDLAKELIKYCLNNQIISNIEIQKDLVDKIIKLVVRFGLSEYVDVESQSSQIQFLSQANGFGLRLNQMSVSDQLSILKLLRDSYVRKLLDRNLVKDPSQQELYIKKHNNLTRLIQAFDHTYLEGNRWARLYGVEMLEYGPKANQDLFRGVFKDRLPDPVEFDELLWQNFNIMLFPAFGNIRFDYGKISIANEGQGCIQDPKLEIWCNNKLIAEASTSTLTLAHKSCVFRFEEKNLQDIRNLGPNRELSIHLLFSKFNHTPFKFVRTKPVWEVQESLAPRREEQDIAALAQKIGVSPQRIQDLAQTRIVDDQDLFESVKKFISEIRRLVEQDDGYVLLATSDGNRTRIPKGEREIQIALKLWLRPMCEALNVDMNRESLTGRGQLDFKFSVGHDLKCLVEVKLFHSRQLEHGLEIQLPTYLVSENVQFGIYVPIVFKPSIYESGLTKLENKARELTQKNDYVIEVIAIKAWKLASASKAVELENPDRYNL